MRVLLIFFFNLTILPFSFAQKTDTVVLSQNLNDEGYVDCLNQTSLYIDSTSIEITETIDSQPFKSLPLFKFKKISFGYSNYTFWLKLTVRNPADTIIHTLFTIGTHKTIEVFRKIDGSYEPLQLTRQEWLPHERPYRYDEKYVPLSFEGQEAYELLIKVTEHPQLYFKLQPKLVSYAWEYEDKIRAFFDEYIYFVHDGFYVSVLFFLSIYLFLLYFVERRLYYLYYACYLCFLLLFGFWAIERSPYTHVIFSYIPILKFSSNNNTYLLLTNIFYYLFINEFLELRRFAPRFSKIVIFHVRYILGGLLVLDTFINFILEEYTLGSYIWFLTQPVIVLFALYGTIELFKLKGTLNRYIQVGSTVLLLGAIIGFSEQILLTKPSDTVLMRLTPSIPFNIGVIIELLCFSTALGFKTWIRQRNRNLLMKSVQESDLRTLRSQINPHFIFNSLNSIKSYILQHRSIEAAEYLTDFSTLMRSTLQHSKEKLILLTDELETALLYVKLEQLRFEDGFEFIYDIDLTIDTDEILTPPLLLQPYLENAIKHGLMNKETDRRLILRVQRSNRQVLVEIDDNGIGREQASLLRRNSIKHQSMGMSINDERLKLLGMTNDLHIDIKVMDKHSAEGEINGTRVMIYFPLDD